MNAGAITLACIAFLLFHKTQLAAPCKERPAANDKTSTTMNAAPESLAQIPPKVKLTEKQIARFWRKVEKTDTCWLWTGSLNQCGYGTLSLTLGKKSRTFLAHRISFCLANNLESISGCVLHKCDVPRCVSPSHLFSGTQVDNMRDMVAKGRPQRVVGYFESGFAKKGECVTLAPCTRPFGSSAPRTPTSSRTRSCVTRSRWRT